MANPADFALLRTFRGLFEGKQYKHRDSSLGDLVASQLYEQVLRFRATNVPPFPFEWVDFEETAKQYGALLVRVSREYDARFL